jgi:hypothetical protein
MVTKSFTSHSGWISRVSHLLEVNVNVGMEVHLDLYACVHFIYWYIYLICETKTIFSFFVERLCHIAGRRLRPPLPRRILQERSRNVVGSCRKSAEIGVSGSSIPSGNLLNFCFACGFQSISGGNTGSTLRRFPVISYRNRPIFFELEIWRSLNY